MMKTSISNNLFLLWYIYIHIYINILLQLTRILNHYICLTYQRNVNTKQFK